ncbi:hypothetical protein KJ966_17025 [bacterium]|nr:hypothetical protein [bacterium]
MEEKKMVVIVFPVKIKTYPNEYSEKLRTGMFTESISIDPLTCVYRRWESTRYSMDGTPTAHMFD